MLGLERGLVRLVPYTSDWKRLFDSERARLLEAIDEQVLDVQHIGSTSIPGMLAKPILDIAIAVEDFDRARNCIQPLVSLGYEYRGENGIPRRHYFILGDPRLYHLHMNELDSPEWQNQLLFRDYLIAHPQAAQAYAALKIELAQRFPADREAYLVAKAPFIEQLLERARDWKG